MTLNVEVTGIKKVFDAMRIADLDEKRIVPKMMLRRRLTRSAKIMLYLSDACGFKDGPVVYGSAFGELQATADIADAIFTKNPISPTAFQNSVYNTAPSYFSIVHGNREEILTISSGNATGDEVIKTGLIQALSLHKEVLLVCVEALDIPRIDEVNNCASYLEAGAACAIRLSEEAPNTVVEKKKHEGFAPSLWGMLDLVDACEGKSNPVVALEL